MMLPSGTTHGSRENHDIRVQQLRTCVLYDHSLYDQTISNRGGTATAVQHVWDERVSPGSLIFSLANICSIDSYMDL